MNTSFILRGLLGLAVLNLGSISHAVPSKVDKSAPQEQKAPPPPQTKKDFLDSILIQNTIYYDHSLWGGKSANTFDNDDANFMTGITLVNGKTKRPYTTFVNMHDGSSAQTTPKWQPNNKRSFKWQIPYEQALRQGMSAIKHSHDQSALLTAWTGGAVRNYVSFVIVPKGTQMEFKIGYAAPQTGKTGVVYSNKTEEMESRPGGGLQIRLRYLPKGTIILTEPLDKDKSGNYNLPNIFQEALKKYNKGVSPDKQLPLNLIQDDLVYQNEKEYVDTSFIRNAKAG